MNIAETLLEFRKSQNPKVLRGMEDVNTEEGIKDMFESEYAKCEYMEMDRAVLHVWKKEAHYDDYREPVKASLEMLKDHVGSIFIVDARNGFEDVKEDVEWGFSYFLPELKKTGCKINVIKFTLTN